MRRYVVADGGWRLEETGQAPLDPRSVRIEMRAWSLNYRDLMVAKGTYGGKTPPGLVPLSDGSGEVVEIGSHVTAFKVGDRVASCFFRDWSEGPFDSAKGKSALGGATDGVLAEQVVLPQHGLVEVPSHLSFEQAATLPCAGLTAWNALFNTARLTPGQTVLVQGTGGVSTFALIFAKAAGARVMATSSSDEKLRRARELGADATVNYKTEPDWHAAAYKWTEGKGVDIVVEVGGADTLPKSLRALAYGGHISVIGVLTGGTSEFPMPYLFSKQARMTGIYVGSRTQFEEMNRGIEATKIVPVIDRVFPFDQASEALAHLESGSHFGKIVIAR